MKVVSINDLQSKSINHFIDLNNRFTIVSDEDSKEEEEVQDVINKIAILREGCSGCSKELS